MNRKDGPEPTPAGTYSIAAIARKTGLSPHVLRVWERRYGAVDPERSQGGQRRYTDAELKRFELLAQATRSGRSISSVARLSEAELTNVLLTDAATAGTDAQDPDVRPDDRFGADADATVQRALLHTIALDSVRLDAELRSGASRHGLPFLLQDVVPSLMRHIGDEWMANRLGIAHEHLASGVVLTILLDSIRAIPKLPTAPRLLVATPSGEHHVIGAALIAAAAALDGWNILFLGADVPADDIASAAIARDASAVALSLVLSQNDQLLLHEIQLSRSMLPSTVPLVLGGSASNRMSGDLVMPGVFVCSSISQARTVLASFVRA